MKPKVLVMQTKIGDNDNYNYNVEEFKKVEKNIFMPSAKEWAKIHGYDYELLTESTIPEHDLFTTKWLRYGGERLNHFDRPEYDYIIHIDTDIFISKNAPEFPLKKGISMVKEKPENIDLKYYEENCIDRNIIKNYSESGYFNTGVLCIDTETGKKLTDYFHKIMNLNDPVINNDNWLGDQDITNIWLLNNSDIIVNELEQNWNYFIMHTHLPKHDSTIDDFIERSKSFITTTEDIDMNKIHFVHFFGPSKFVIKLLLKKLRYKS